MTTADGCTLCLTCNQSCEADGQPLALAMGWKIRRNRGSIRAEDIPIFDVNDRTYYLIDEHGSRLPITRLYALELLDAAGSLTRTLTP